MSQTTFYRGFMLAAAVALLTPAAVWAIDPIIGYSLNPSGGTGNITASGGFMPGDGYTTVGITVYAFNSDDTKPAVVYPLVAGTDFNAAGGPWNATFNAAPGVYMVYAVLQVKNNISGENSEYNTPSVADVLVN